MSYKALYRRFRPIVFEEIIGQSETVATLKNQIINKNLAHAYLFIGSRGTGKTTTAKILSRAINCLEPIDANPCNNCRVCQSILNDSNMDVIEMDAASNNGVDDIRELREIVKFPPTSASYKVIIIDEVHMLSRGAFNALLKTLEEPPEYMVFILATTEPHKVPATIISRCQRFDFKKIKKTAMLGDLTQKCQTLCVDVEVRALELIVKLSEGAMRDAQSLLDQCLSYAGENLTYEQAARILGRTADKTVLELASALMTVDENLILSICDLNKQKGKDATVLIADLIEIFRVAMRLSFSSEFDDSLLAPESLDKIRIYAQQYNKKQLILQLNALLDAYQKVKSSSHPFIMLEISLLEVAELANGKTNSNQDKSMVVNINNKNKETVNKRFTEHKQEQKLKEEQPREKNIIEENKKDEIVEHIAAEINFIQIKERWQEYLQNVKAELNSTYAMLQEAKVFGFETNILKLQLASGHEMLEKFLLSPQHKNNLIKAFDKTFGKLKDELVIQFVSVENNSNEAELIDFFSQYTDMSNINIIK